MQVLSNSFSWSLWKRAEALAETMLDLFTYQPTANKIPFEPVHAPKILGGVNHYKMWHVQIIQAKLHSCPLPINIPITKKTGTLYAYGWNSTVFWKQTLKECKASQKMVFYIPFHHYLAFFLSLQSNLFCVFMITTRSYTKVFAQHNEQALQSFTEIKEHVLHLCTYERTRKVIEFFHRSRCSKQSRLGKKLAIFKDS